MAADLAAFRDAINRRSPDIPTVIEDEDLRSLIVACREEFPNLEPDEFTELVAETAVGCVVTFR